MKVTIDLYYNHVRVDALQVTLPAARNKHPQIDIHLDNCVDNTIIPNRVSTALRQFRAKLARATDANRIAATKTPRKRP